MNKIYAKLSGIQFGSPKSARVIQTSLAAVIGFVAGFIQFTFLMILVYALTDVGEMTEQVVTGRGFQTTVYVENEPSGMILALMSISVIALLVLPCVLAVWYWLRSGQELRATAAS